MGPPHTIGVEKVMPIKAYVTNTYSSVSHGSSRWVFFWAIPTQQAVIKVAHRQPG